MSQPDDDKTQAVTVLSKGTVINHYRIVEKIGAGGMGEVYLAEDTELNRKVALKFLSPHLCQDADCRARFKREAQAAAKLDHPHIVTVYEVGEFNGRPFFAMQHIEGRSLREYAHAQELTIPQIFEIGIQIAEGLQAAHEKGVTHRDIKPANVLIDTHGRARILDFGLASVAGVDHLTKTGSTLGTIGYMSPEQVRGEQIDQRTDIFSLGVVLYELIAGRQPFKGDSNAATSRNILDIDPEPIARYKSGASAELQRVISKALAKDRKLRYQHADDLATDLRQQLSPSGSHQTARSRRTRLIVIPAVLLLLAIVAVVFKPWQLLDRSAEQSTTENKRVVVLPFRNQTDDPSLDALGKMVADWTTQSLLQTGLAEVVPPEALLEIDAGSGTSGVADATGARIIVSGAYYKVGDSLQFQAQVSAADERLLQAIEPVYSQMAKMMDGVESVRQRVLGALALLLDERLYGKSVQTARPPTYLAYQEYIQGVVDHRSVRDWAAAEQHYRQAYAIDTTFLAPLLGACAANLNLGRKAALDTLIQFLSARRGFLTALQQMELDLDAALLASDRMKALDFARKAARLAPGTGENYQLAWQAVLVNRPLEAIEALKGMDPEMGWARDWSPYWTQFATAYHMVGSHDQELEIARRGRSRFPVNVDVWVCELSALAALGRLSEIKRSIDEGEAIRRHGGTLGYVIRTVGEELRAHGFETEAMEMLDRAIKWYQNRPTQEVKALRPAFAFTLYNARQWKEAQSVFSDLANEFSDEWSYRGWLGLVAARLGDRLVALEISDWLKDLKTPYPNGDNTYYRACIASILGDKDQAIALLKESFLQGKAHDMSLHRDFDFESLWDYPPFLELLKPKG